MIWLISTLTVPAILTLPTQNIAQPVTVLIILALAIVRWDLMAVRQIAAIFVRGLYVLIAVVKCVVQILYLASVADSVF